MRLIIFCNADKLQWCSSVVKSDGLMLYYIWCWTCLKMIKPLTLPRLSNVSHYIDQVFVSICLHSIPWKQNMWPSYKSFDQGRRWSLYKSLILHCPRKRFHRAITRHHCVFNGAISRHLSCWWHHIQKYLIVQTVVPKTVLLKELAAATTI